MKSSLGHVTQFYLALIALVLPWLNPFAAGPSPAVSPWLVTLFAIGFLLLFASLREFQHRPLSGAAFAQRWASLAASAWLFVGILSSGIALLQYFSVTDVFEPWVNHTRLGEAYANLRQRNGAGGEKFQRFERRAGEGRAGAASGENSGEHRVG